MKKIGDYTLIKLIGKGSFGETYLTEKNNFPYLIATKVINRKKIENLSTKKYLDNEINILKELDHPNIVKFYEQLNTKSNIYIMMEFCNGGELSHCLKLYKSVYKNTFNIEIVQYFMRQIINAFCYIHSKKIIHRDIKLENILLSFENENDKQNLNLLTSKVKIIDFGLSTKLTYSSLTYTALGSPVNMDPLILKKFDKAGGYKNLLGYNEKADIWSLGTIFYELLTGQLLFEANSMKDLMEKVEAGNYVIPINQNFYKESVSFLNCMLQYNPDDRLSVTELAQHDFIVKNVREFTKVDIKQVFNKLDRKGLVINVKDNKTIRRVFSIDSSNNDNKNNYNNNNQNNIRRYERLNTEQGYSHTGDIYSFISESEKSSNNNNNDKIFNHRRQSDGVVKQNNIIKIPIDINKQKNNNRRFTEGFISPKKNNNNRNFELIKLEEELREKERKEKEEHDKLIMERQRQELIERQNIEKEKRVNWDKGREEIKVYLNGLLIEYLSAKEYFNKNGLTKQEEDSNSKLLKIQDSLNHIDQGLSIYYDNLPQPITTEYIYNCSTNIRNSIFKQVLNKYEEDKKELTNNLTSEILKLKKLDKKSFDSIKASIMPKLENDKKKIETIKKIIDNIQDKYNNKWTPPPSITKEYVQGNNKKISDIDDIYQIIIHAGKSNYNSSNLVLKFSMKTNNNKTFTGDIKILNYGDFEEDLIWNLTQTEINDISKYIIHIKYYSNKLYLGSVKINISELKEKREKNEFFPIAMPRQSSPSQTIINICIKLKCPENKPNISSSGKKEIIKVNKFYPPFNGKCPDTNNIPSMFMKNK